MIYILLSVSLIINIALVIGVVNLLKQNEELEDTLTETLADIKGKVNTALQALKDADIKGSFESDDEVGVVFTQMKDIVENLNEVI